MEVESPTFIETIKKFRDNDKMVCRVFIDLEKSFDTVNHVILLEILNHQGIRSKENDCFGPFLINRKQYVSIKGFFSQTNFLCCGITQSSTLASLFFHSHKKPKKYTGICVAHHSADDTNLQSGNKCPSEISE